MRYLILVLIFVRCNVYESPQTIEVTGTVYKVTETHYEIFINEPKGIWETDFIRIPRVQEIKRGFVCKFDVYEQDNKIKVYGDLRCFDPIPHKMNSLENHP